MPRRSGRHHRQARRQRRQVAGDRAMNHLQIGRCMLLALTCASPAAGQPPPEVARWFAPQIWQRDTDGPILSLGEAAQFDDMHIFAPTVAEESGKFLLWYSGSRGTPGN